MTPEIAVVVPTFNRAATLGRCLEALERQSLDRDRFEIIVVDDGSTDGTPGLLAEAVARGAGRLRALRQENRGPAAARNAGIAAARAPVVLLLDDDILAGADLLKEHLEWHRRESDPLAALLGHVRWAGRVEVTPFMRFVDSNGMQFAYDGLEDGQRLDFRHFYACNLSLKRRTLATNPFDSGFPAAAFEDIELGWRLERLGLRFHYRRAAETEHDRTITFAEFRERMRRAGASLRLLHDRHPATREVLRPPRRRPFSTVWRGAKARLAPLLPPRLAGRVLASYWRAALTDAMARGYGRRLDNSQESSAAGRCGSSRSSSTRR